MAKGEEPPAEQPTQVSQAQREEVHKALEGETQEVANLGPFHAQELKEREQDITLKGWYAWILIGLLAAQIAIVDFVLTMYAWKGVDWRVEAWVVDVWLGATVVEVIAIVLVVTQHLFPRRDRQ